MSDVAVPHPSDSRAQRDAELVILAALSETLGVPLAKESIPTANAGRVEVDGVSPDGQILVEVFAHHGRVRTGQSHKLAKDILKLVWLRMQRPEARIVIAIADLDVERYLSRPTAWLTEAIKDLKVDIVRVDLDEVTTAAIRAAQIAQER